MSERDPNRTAEAWWGGTGGVAPEAQAQAYEAQIGKPPRPITAAYADWVASKAAPWYAPLIVHPILARLSLALAPIALVLILAMALFFWPVLIVPPVVIGLVVWSAVKHAREARGKLQSTWTDGRLVPAVVKGLRAAVVVTSRRPGLFGSEPSVVRYALKLAVEGRELEWVAFDGGLALLQEGLSIPVLWDERNPDVVIPVFLLGA